MHTPRPSVARLVGVVLLAERAGTSGVRDSEVVCRVMARLCQDLGQLIGADGFDVLLARSLVLARRSHPALAVINAGKAGSLLGFDQPGPDGAPLQEGAVAIVAHFIELLVSLIGEDLAIRLVRGVWPAATEEGNQ